MFSRPKHLASTLDTAFVCAKKESPNISHSWFIQERVEIETRNPFRGARHETSLNFESFLVWRGDEVCESTKLNPEKLSKPLSLLSRSQKRFVVESWSSRRACTHARTNVRLVLARWAQSPSSKSDFRKTTGFIAPLGDFLKDVVSYRHETTVASQCFSSFYHTGNAEWTASALCV